MVGPGVPQESGLPPDDPRSEHSRPDETHRFQLTFGTAQAAASYAGYLASLLDGVATATIALTSKGNERDHLEPDEIAQRLRLGIVTQLRAELELQGASAQVLVSLDGQQTGEVLLVLPLSGSPSIERIWLQCAPELLTPLQSLALPTRPGAFAYEALHGLVGLAVRTGGFVSALLRREDVLLPARWQAQSDEATGRSLVGSIADTNWYACDRDDGSGEARFLGEFPSRTPILVDDDWWAESNALLTAPTVDLDALRDHFDRVFLVPFDWCVADLAQTQAPDDLIPAESGVTARLVPRPDHVCAAVDFSQPPKAVADALLHLCGHCELGHVRPGDDWGHWDTAWTSTSEAAHRQWDRDANDLVSSRGRLASGRRVESLQDCTALEKGWLVLLRQIGRMVGTARALHPKAEQYQAAAYQRQAAQRLVAQLEDYSGAMLCDGVGLGKTYVATTVMVHYANAWRDQLAQTGRSTSDDPFRITILAPNSVVSTWQREALPPLAVHGVSAATVRVLSHTKLSRILRTSKILKGSAGRLSDMAHLLLSDLVIVDEAHNFRSVSAQRTVVLRDLLRTQPRKDVRRRVLLLTATPVNNSLADLRQQAALLFSKPLWFNDNLTADGYRGRVARDVQDRLAAARKNAGTDVAAVLIHGTADARFSVGSDFRDDLPFGAAIPHVGAYLKEQEVRLHEQQQAVRTKMLAGTGLEASTTRVAAELLDRIVVQRSRQLCKQIEQEQGSDVRLLFRPDAPPPERLVYEDIYDDTQDVLRGFLPLFETSEDPGQEDKALSLNVYAWSGVRVGQHEVSETSSVVGLQRILVLKRLESSPIAFLVTLLRLLALHAHRLRQLHVLCLEAGDRDRADELSVSLSRTLEALPYVARERLDLLLTGEVSKCAAKDLLARWSKAHTSRSTAASEDDPLPAQFDMFAGDDDQSLSKCEQLSRLWQLKGDLERDFETLLGVAPNLAHIIFGRFEREDWPKRFIAGGSRIDWPKSATWGMRLVTDAKLRRLVARVLLARRSKQKVIVFSQFTDTLAYIESVLRATHAFDRNEWRMALPRLAADADSQFDETDVRNLAAQTAVVSGQTDERDDVINAFAPFYRMGPARPAPGPEGTPDHSAEMWQAGWTRAMERPLDVLLASDVLAEGVNLQDVSLLVNYDVHWNPVRMIQRAGRVDRRLKPSVEDAESFPDLERLAEQLGTTAPHYWWHDHRDAAPATVNLLLPDELEKKLQLRERIANKTLAIDFTLGLEQGTGAEAEWMAEYRYHGVSALNVWQKDRAIERVAGYQERLRRLMAERGMSAEWEGEYNGWLREVGLGEEGQILAHVCLHGKGDASEPYWRQIQPLLVDEVPHWLWTFDKPSESLENFWLVLDRRTRPPSNVRRGLPWSEDASRPISAEDVLFAAVRLIDDRVALEERGSEIGLLLSQGAAAISAGFNQADADRRYISREVGKFQLLQLQRGEQGGQE